jgi:Zn-dependent M16 (insulinase) family peptidase
MELKPIYKVGDSHGNFRCTKALPIEELQLVLYEFSHDPTGAQVIHLASDDRENLFCISFQTLPSDSTGVAHILEHTVLCGSKKYPVKDPFFSMSRRSLNTFMNALTGADFTCYPASSQVETDFYNLLSVYLDAVFSPKLKELSFLQEGHRLEFEKADDSSSPLLFKGVVYNEMKGSMSAPETRLWQKMTEFLTPDLTYAYNSGGDPAMIPSLTYEGLKNFHQTFYHPSRSLFFFYGNLPLKDHLDFLEKESLQGVKKAPKLPRIPLQKRFQEPIEKEMFYPLSEKDLSKKSFVSFSWLTTPIGNQQDALGLAVIDSILMETDASPLKFALLESQLCTQADGYLDVEMSEIPYAIICRGADVENSSKLKEILFNTLRNLVAKGIDPVHLEGAIHQLEFSRLEITGDYGPFGLTLFMRAALAKQHGCAPENALVVHEQFKTLRKAVEDPHYLSSLIKKYLIDNPHFLQLTMRPSHTLEEEEEKEENNRLQKIQETLSEEEKKKIISTSAELKKYQEETENQSLDCLPKVELADVPKETIDFPLEEREHQQLSLFHHECFTNHITYAKLLFELPNIEIDELCYVQLLMTLLPELGVNGKSYQHNLEYINSYLGGFGTVLQLYPQMDDPTILKPVFGFRGKALERYSDKLFLLMKEFCLSPRFDERERIKTLILQIHTSQQNRLNRSALSYAVQQALSSFSPSATIGQKWHGIDYTFFIRELVKDLDHNLSKIQEKLERLYSRLFHLNHPHLVISSDAKQRQVLAQHDYFDLGKLPTQSFCPWKGIAPIECKQKGEGRITSTPVAFSAWGFKACTALDPQAPALSLSTNLLENTYLHQKIREQGGAYGSGAHYSPLSGHFYFYSYRDPHISSTYQAFKEGIDRLIEGKFSEGDLEEAKLGLVQDADSPISPGSRASISYGQKREGRSKERRQQFRNQMLGVTKQDIQEVAKNTLKKIENEGVAVSYANEKLLKQENPKLAYPLSILPLS